MSKKSQFGFWAYDLIWILGFGLWILRIIDFLEKLQKKPKHVRQQIMWTAVVVCMLIIFALWVFSLKYSFQKATEQESKSLIPEEVSSSVQKMQEQWQEKQKDIKSNLPSVFENQGNQESPFEGQNQE